MRLRAFEYESSALSWAPRCLHEGADSFAPYLLSHRQQASDEFRYCSDRGPRSYEGGECFLLLPTRVASATTIRERASTTNPWLAYSSPGLERLRGRAVSDARSFVHRDCLELNSGHSSAQRCAQNRQHIFFTSPSVQIADMFRVVRSSASCRQSGDTL
jgi:hypothetical protein